MSNHKPGCFDYLCEGECIPVDVEAIQTSPCCCRFDLDPENIDPISECQHHRLQREALDAAQAELERERKIDGHLIRKFRMDESKLRTQLEAAPHDVMCASISIHCNDGIHTIYQDEATPCNCWKSKAREI